MADTTFRAAALASPLAGAGPIYRGAHREGSTTAYATTDNFEATTAPGASNDNTAGYHIGSQWFNKNTGAMYVCRDASTGAAVWNRVRAGDYISGNYYVPPRVALASGSAPGIDSLRLFPLVDVRERIIISELGARVTTPQASNNFRCGIWAANRTTGRPTGAVLAETGNISTGSSGNVSGALGANQAIEPGQGVCAWLGLVCSHATPVFAAIAPSSELFAATIGTATLANLLASSTTGIIGLSTPHTFGALPNLTSATFTEQTGTTIPLIFFKVA